MVAEKLRENWIFFHHLNLWSLCFKYVYSLDYVFFFNFNYENTRTITTQRIRFSIKDFFSKCDQIHNDLRIWSHLLKNSLMEHFIFCAVYVQNWDYFNNFYGPKISIISPMSQTALSWRSWVRFFFYLVPRWMKWRVYWNCTSSSVLSCKFAALFQNTFS